MKIYGNRHTPIMTKVHGNNASPATKKIRLANALRQNAQILSVDSYAQALYSDIADILPRNISANRIASEIASYVDKAQRDMAEQMDNPELEYLSTDEIFIDYASKLDFSVFEPLAVWLIESAISNGVSEDEAMNRINPAMESILP